MSASDPFQHDSQNSSGLALNLSSNNPFRNRAVSPGPSSPFEDPPARPLSRNPFLDHSSALAASPPVQSNKPDTKSLSAEEIFSSLTLDETKAQRAGNTTNGIAPPPYRPVAAPRTGENRPPPDSIRRHKPTISQEEALRARRMQPPSSGRPDAAGASPSRRAPPPRRPRRNSDSSVLDFDTMPLTEEEKRMIARRRDRERQRREAQARGEKDPREARDKTEARGKDAIKEGRETREAREGKPRSKSGRPSRRMDIIDQLDATSIYGTGLFHHDGPFDALNPHRNRNASRRAPMQAFPKDSLNNCLGGVGPLNKTADHSTFLGQGHDEAFRDFASGSTGKNKNGYTYQSTTDAPIFDPIARGDVIHGDESVGLGTSTFLEGTPAARTAIVRNRQEQAQDFVEGGGLQRKKSLAQRIRHINKGPRTPEGYGARDVSSVGTAEANPFFSEYGKGEESFAVKPRDGAMSPTRVPRRGSAGAPLERRVTADGTMASEDGSKSGGGGGGGGGFLGRMKSLKGGKRPTRNPDLGPPSPPQNPGTAI